MEKERVQLGEGKYLETETMSRLISGYTVLVERYYEYNNDVKKNGGFAIYMSPAWEDGFDDQYLLIEQADSKWGKFDIIGPIGLNQAAINIAKKLSEYRKDLEYTQNDVLIGLIQHVMRRCVK